MEIHLTVTCERNEAFTEFLLEKIKEYNNEHSVHHREACRLRGTRSLYIIVEQKDHEWLGGLTAQIYWNWLEIEYFWLHEKCRKQGIGTKILMKAEEIAISLGCTKALLSTFDFQGKTFYEQNGYTVAGQLNDYPPGNTYYWMTKELDKPVSLDILKQ